MKYATVRPMQVENIKSLRGNEIDQLVVDYHIKDLKSYLLGRETKESARSSTLSQNLCNCLSLT